MKHFEEHSHTYQTGRTQPPKSHQGLVAVSLIAVVLITGTFSILTLLNVRLHRMSEGQDSRSVRFCQESSDVAALSLEQEPDGVIAPALGIGGQEFTSLYRSYQAWPQGIYISWIDPEGPAAAAGLQIGDILVALEDRPVTDQASFEAALSSQTWGQAVRLTVFRDGEELTFPIIVR